MKITFLGAVGEVTGSRYLIEHNDAKILVDCGLFQGDRMLTQRNWTVSCRCSNYSSNFFNACPCRPYRLYSTLSKKWL